MWGKPARSEHTSSVVCIAVTLHAEMVNPYSGLSMLLFFCMLLHQSKPKALVRGLLGVAKGYVCMHAMWFAGGFHHCFAWGWGYFSKERSDRLLTAWRDTSNSSRLTTNIWGESTRRIFWTSMSINESWSTLVIWKFGIIKIKKNVSPSRNLLDENTVKSEMFWNIINMKSQAEFSASLLQSSGLHDPSKIIIICWFADFQCWKQMCYLMLFWKPWYFLAILWWIESSLNSIYLI